MILGKRLSFLQGGPLHIQVQRPDLSEEKEVRGPEREKRRDKRKCRRQKVSDHSVRRHRAGGTAGDDSKDTDRRRSRTF